MGAWDQLVETKEGLFLDLHLTYCMCRRRNDTLRILTYVKYTFLYVHFVCSTDCFGSRPGPRYQTSSIVAMQGGAQGETNALDSMLSIPRDISIILLLPGLRVVDDLTLLLLL